MDSNPTLHDFVLNLITNQDARLAFELDPEGSLRDAGLGDLTPTDVQEVVPLVFDLAPVQGLTGLLPVQDLGLGSLTSDPTAVIGQLQEILAVGTQTVGTLTTSASADFNVAALGAITVDPLGLNGSASLQTSGDLGITADGGVTAGLSPVNDVVGTLDVGALDNVVGTATGLIGADGGLLGGAGGVLPSTDPVLGSLDVTVNTVTSVVGDVTGGLGGTLDGVVGGNLLGSADVTVSTVTNVVGDVTGGLGGTLDGVGSLTGGLTGSLGLGGEAHASSDGGLLGLTDGLL